MNEDLKGQIVSKLRQLGECAPWKLPCRDPRLEQLERFLEEGSFYEIGALLVLKVREMEITGAKVPPEIKREALWMALILSSSPLDSEAIEEINKFVEETAGHAKKRTMFETLKRTVEEIGGDLERASDEMFEKASKLALDLVRGVH